ncbi:hypothetical protein Tco_0213709 [Tanacetum coccineum]
MESWFIWLDKGWELHFGEDVTDLAIEEAYTTKYSIHLGADTMVWLWVVEGLTLERCSTFGKKDKLESSYVGPFDILGWIGPIVRLRISVLQFLFDELRVKVRWDSKRGPELTLERKDQMRSRELKRNGNVICFKRLTSRSMTSTGYLMKFNLSTTWISSSGIARGLSAKHFFNFET